jgi:XTP/dITP diphosphohydrolase
MEKITSLVLATHNVHKIQEIKRILGSIVTFRTLQEFVPGQIKETGHTLHENSLAKALYAHTIAKLPSLADDSGLFVKALNGEPGVFSARYGRTDVQRIQRVLMNLEGQKDRRAEFRAVFVLVRDSTTNTVFEGICQGTIACKPRGDHGFGYDPIFIPDGYTQTFAELGPGVKNSMSHRALALKKVRMYLSQ